MNINSLKYRFFGHPPFKVTNDDVFLASYPKSGSTWVRLFLCYYRLNHDFPLSDVNLYIPNFNQLRKGISYDTFFSNPRIIKSHKRLNPHLGKAIYLTRDPRDVASSYYHYLKKCGDIDSSMTVPDFVSKFVAGKFPAGSWSDHVSSAMERNKTLIIQYENLKNDPVSNFSSILDFLGLDIHEERFQMAMEKSSFDKLKSKEESEGFENKTSGRQLKNFFRKGGSGSWQSELDQESADNIKSNFEKPMRELGYE